MSQPAPPQTEGDSLFEREPLDDSFRDRDQDLRGYEPIQPEPGWKAFARKLWAPIAALGALLAKFKFLLFALFKLKLFATAATMLVSVGAYALL